MWNKTKVTERLGIQYPIIQGPFGGGASSAKLVSSVSNAGGLGSYGAYHLQPAEIEEINTSIKTLTQRPYAINLWVSDVDIDNNDFSIEEFEKLKAVFKPFFDELKIPLPEKPEPVVSKFEKQAETILRIKPPVFSFVFGIPSGEIIRECKRQQIVTIGTATTLDEATALENARVDLIVATGFEAGGHRPSFLHSAEESLTGTFALIAQIADNINTPIIAAGGIIDARGIVAALTLGASAAQIGTAFLACEESNALPEHRQILFSKRARHSTLTRSFSGRLARGIPGTISEATKESHVAPFPLQRTFMRSLQKAAIEQGRRDILTFWAGQGAPILKHRKATDLFNSLVAETERILQNWNS
jgi:nitronate monooxygenase